MTGLEFYLVVAGATWTTVQLMRLVLWLDTPRR